MMNDIFDLIMVILLGSLYIGITGSVVVDVIRRLK